MIRSIPFAIGLVTLSAALVSSPSIAQPGGGVQRGGGGPAWGGAPGGGLLGLLQQESVRDEIQLVGEQQRQLQALADDLRAEMQDQMRDLMGQMRDLGPAERQARMEDIRAQMADIQQDTETRLQKVLMPHQFQRLKQIELQTRLQRGGAQALSSGDLADALGLTDEQREQLARRAQEVQRELEEQIRQLRIEARRKLLDALTAEQRAKLEAMLGDEFALPEGGPAASFGQPRQNVRQPAAGRGAERPTRRGDGAN